MTALTAVSLLLGAALALRFKVFILIPVIIGGLVIGTVAGIALAADFWSLIVAMIVASTALQFGYLGGTAVVSFSTMTTRQPEPIRVRWEDAFLPSRSGAPLVPQLLAQEYPEGENEPRRISPSLGECLQRHYLPVLKEPIPGELMALVQRL